MVRWFVVCLCSSAIASNAESTAGTDDADFFAFLPPPGPEQSESVGSDWRVVWTNEPWTSHEEWHPQLKEDDVMLARLFHESSLGRSWSLGVGNGGQIYSLRSTFGEVMPPQTPESPWMDEVWQLVTLYGNAHRMGSWPETIAEQGNGFVHQSGPYGRTLDKRPFYSPRLAVSSNEKSRSFSVLSWSQVPTASVIRSEVLTYARYSDLGSGVIQADWVVANFSPEPLTEMDVWGGHRTSLLPEQVLSRPDGTYRFFTPFGYKPPKSSARLDETGGWAAAVKNADDPYSHGVGFVFGNPPDRNYRFDAPARFDSGDSRHGRRDYTVQAIVVYSPGEQGSVQHIRTYFVLGSLNKIAEKANELAKKAEYNKLSLDPADSPLVRLSISKGMLTRRNQSGVDLPALHAYAWPVKNSRPLFVMKDPKTGDRFLSSDPYARCHAEPLDASHSKLSESDRKKFGGKPVYNVPRNGAEIIEFLGFASTGDSAEREGLEAVAVPSIVVSNSVDPDTKQTLKNLYLFQTKPTSKITE